MLSKEAKSIFTALLPGWLLALTLIKMDQLQYRMKTCFASPHFFLVFPPLSRHYKVFKSLTSSQIPAAYGTSVGRYFNYEDLLPAIFR